MLHDPARHEPLKAIVWDESRARGCIKHIVSDAEDRFTPENYWPQHPRDVDAGEDPGDASTTLYYGATGVLWALQYLQRVHEAWGQPPPAVPPLMPPWVSSAGSSSLRSWSGGRSVRRCAICSTGTPSAYAFFAMAAPFS